MKEYIYKKGTYIAINLNKINTNSVKLIKGTGTWKFFRNLIMYKFGDLSLVNSYIICSFCLSSSAYQDREENKRRKSKKTYDKDILISEGKTKKSHTKTKQII